VAREISIAVLISGGGTTLKNLIDRVTDGSCHARIKCVLSSKESARGLLFAEEEAIPTVVVPKKKHRDTSEFSELVTESLRAFAPELIVFGGFLSLYLFPPEYHHRIINIHPALLPSFGGKGMYGDHVHEAVLKAGCKVTGCTVHFVDEVYDCGPIIAQRAVPVLEGDTVETLGERVRTAERGLYPVVINWFAEGRVCVTADGRVQVAGRNLLEDAHRG
jgi:phosphoribosylglycinamide formyltransferase-1